MRADELHVLTHRKCSELSHGSTQKSKDTMGPYSDSGGYKEQHRGQSLG